MRSFAIALGLLLIALCRPSFAQEESSTAGDTGVVWADVVYSMGRPLQLNCTSAGADRAGITVSWQVNGTEPDASALRGRYKLSEKGGDELRIEATIEADYGNYTCLMNGMPANSWRVAADPVLRIPPNSNVVEGQKLKLTCRVFGKPYPAVTWWYAEDEDAPVRPVADLNVTDSAAGVPGGELVLDPATPAQAGRYTCRAHNNATATTTVRVKDMYAALWPFLGICLEVFILCAIILVYEKRRTKPEHDDSDTDNHEQKKG